MFILFRAEHMDMKNKKTSIEASSKKIDRVLEESLYALQNS